MDFNQNVLENQLQFKKDQRVIDFSQKRLFTKTYFASRLK